METLTFIVSSKFPQYLSKTIFFNSASGRNSSLGVAGNRMIGCDGPFLPSAL